MGTVRALPSIFDRQASIVREFDEPLRDVVAGFVPMGMTRVEVAEALDVDYRSLRTFCEREQISFSPNQPGRLEKIRGKRNGRARRVRMNGVTLCLSEWAERAGVNYRTLQTRLRRGMSLSAALHA